MNTKQLTKELASDFLERFRRMRSKCNVQFPKSEYETIKIGKITKHLMEQLLTQDCADLAHIAIKAIRIK